MSSSQSRGRKFQNVRGFEVRQQIGGGGFSKVYLGINSKTEQVAAVKVINLTAPAAGRPSRKELEKEVKVHRMMKHQYVLEFFDAVLVEEGGEFIPGLFMLLEYASMGDLFDKIVPDLGVDDDCAHFFFYQLMAGIEFIHTKGVAHRDIKPENLLLDGGGNLKISDFGLCSVFRLNGQERTLSGRCGSLPYIAPELNDSGNYHAEPVDVWGAGIVLFTLICGNTPWDEPTSYSPEFAAYLTGELLTVAPWTRLGDKALDIIQRILEVDPKKRITVPELWRHPWLHQRPSQRLGAESRARTLLTGMVESGEMEITEPAVSVSVALSQAHSASQRQKQHSTASSMDEDMDYEDDDPTLRAPPRATYEAAMTQSFGMMTQWTSNGQSRQIPNLTRCYSEHPPSVILPILLDLIGRYPDSAPIYLPLYSSEDDDPASAASPNGGGARMGQDSNGVEVGGRIKFLLRDSRKQLLDGAMVVEHNAGGDSGVQLRSLVVMKRTKGDQLEWRKLWTQIRDHPLMVPLVYNHPRGTGSSQRTV
ncbi:kinase-like domain-containing protein [Mrakia frigida]|uniref:kinase-like domain-containing protein n=1 Tax=Mrakia frigida TaxID=29902 RepID=UPI003FCC19BD